MYEFNTHTHTHTHKSFLLMQINVYHCHMESCDMEVMIVVIKIHDDAIIYFWVIFQIHLISFQNQKNKY
jgi:hypothetical protein